MAKDSKGYYKALGLAPGASIDEIKKVYRKKQIELHPSGPVRRKMKESPEYLAMKEEQKAAKDAELDELLALINQAFSVLSDEKKKADYDEGVGEFGDFQAGGFGGFGGFDGFSEMFAHMAGGRRQGGGPSKVKDIKCDLKIDIKDVFLGKKSKFRIKRTKTCKSCNGKGGKDVNTCGKCKGRGTVYAKFNLGIISGSQEVECPDCDGQGSVLKGPVCSECSGKKVVEESNIIEVVVKPGIENGDTIVFSKQGNEYPGYAQGDVVFNVVVNEDQNNFRLGDHFITTAEIDILTALAGGILYYNHPDGRKLAIKVQPFKDFDNTGIVLLNEGFASRRGGRGKLYIKPCIRINPGLNREKLSEYLKPLLTKPAGDYSSANSVLESIPSDQDYEYERRSSRGRESGGFGFDVENFASFFG